MKLDTCDILIVNCNTSDLTNIAISSIFSKLNSFKFDIYVFDNSYDGTFQLTFNNLPFADKINIIDNTKHQIVDFVEEYNRSRNKNMKPEHFGKVNQGSFKHMISVQKFMDKYQSDNLLLFDSDIILKKDIDFCDDQFLTVSDIELNFLRDKPGDFQVRFRPFLQYFNLKQMRKLNLQYFQPEIEPDYGRDEKYKSLQFDTGTAFFLKCLRKKNTIVKNINSSDYIYHLFAGTRRHDKQDINQWIKLAQDNNRI